LWGIEIRWLYACGACHRLISDTPPACFSVLGVGPRRKVESHDNYTNAFERLVRDLKKSQPPIIMKGG
jgi:hypothetical protein